MSTAQSPGPRGSTGERSHGHVDLVPLTANFTKMLTKGSARFGALSHHSFFSRHNPHPNRVKHIQGKNIFSPHAQVNKETPGNAFIISNSIKSQFCTLVHCLAALSAEKFTLFEIYYFTSVDFVIKMDRCVSVFQETQEDGFVRRQTQYSAETGRIIPPSSKSYHRKSYSHDVLLSAQVLEVLCQILQTDSLSTVQQWLLLAGQRGKLCSLKEVCEEVMQPFELTTAASESIKLTLIIKHCSSKKNQFQFQMFHCV
uniref:Thymus, brain and testes associated n=1 Tax=Salarias fasciatus TaxID=181472 RepID=A0A672I7M5_SALFA